MTQKEKRQEITDLHFDLKYPNHFFLSTGVALGAGWQSTVAYVNIACYYLIGIPVGVVLGYVVNLQVKVSTFFFTRFNKCYYTYEQLAYMHKHTCFVLFFSTFTTDACWTYKTSSFLLLSLVQRQSSMELHVLFFLLFDD